MLCDHFEQLGARLRGVENRLQELSTIVSCSRIVRSALASALDTMKLLTVLPSKAAACSIRLLAAGFSLRLRRSLLVEAVSDIVITSLLLEHVGHSGALIKITGPSDLEASPWSPAVCNRLDSHSRP
jgi:hypothetical protein